MWRRSASSAAFVAGSLLGGLGLVEVGAGQIAGLQAACHIRRQRAASRPWEEQRLASKARGGRSGPSTAKTSTAAGTAAKTVVAISGSGTWGNGFRIAPAEQQEAQTLHLCESAAGAARDGETWLALEAAPPASPAGLAIAW